MKTQEKKNLATDVSQLLISLAYFISALDEHSGFRLRLIMLLLGKQARVNFLKILYNFENIADKVEAADG